MSDLVRRSRPFGESTWLEPLPAMARFSFRGAADAVAAVSSAFGVNLPTEACRAVSVGQRSAWWLGPDEHLLLAPEADRADILSAVATALCDVPHSMVDISHRHTAFRLKGPQAAWLLGSGCPLDLDLAAFPLGMCTRTVYAKSEIYLWRTGEDVFHVESWRSFVPYVVGLLVEAAQDVVA